MARQQVEHVVEEADAGRDRRAPGAVKVDADLDGGLLRGPLHGRFAHLEFLRGAPRALYQGFARSANRRAIALPAAKS
jgi:hypothetical protein